MSQPILIPPYGGKLKDLLVSSSERDEMKRYAAGLPSIKLTQRQLCDLELLTVGAFSPLDRFMGEADYQRVLDENRLMSGHLFPIPVTLSVNPGVPIQPGEEIALRTPKDDLVAVMTIEEVYEWNHQEASQKVFGTLDKKHPLVSEMLTWGSVNISGPIKVIQLPPAYDFQELRLTPAQTRARLETFGYDNIVAFQTRNPLHRVHEELTKRAIEDVNGVLLLHPVVGLTKPGDVDHYIRVRTYKALTQHYYDANRVLLSLLPLAMRMAGPREAVLHAIIRRNYGANHLIVGRDHAGPGNDSTGKSFYGPYDAQELVEQYSDELGVKVVPFRMVSYIPDEDRYEEDSEIPEGTKIWSLSGTQVREDFLGKGEPLPQWFTRPEVAAILAASYPPRYRQGVCIWLSGEHEFEKSATAEVLSLMLLEYGRQATILDSTHAHLSPDFSFLAAEIVRHGGIVVCADSTSRDTVRQRVGSENFIETDGLLTEESVSDTVTSVSEENARAVIHYLIEQGFVKPI